MSRHAVRPSQRGCVTSGAGFPKQSPDLPEIVNEERTRLLKAQAVLGCLAFALLYKIGWSRHNGRPSPTRSPQLETSSMRLLIGLVALTRRSWTGDGGR